jgi:phosphatidylserine/phosphatidylglycerophosphate/cardiolipin synthase-like enzyme
MILSPGKNCIDIFDAETHGLFVDARDYYLAFADAARQARRYIVITGWQFDSEVRLVRGKDVRDRAAAGSLLNFMNELCRENPELEIFILAWDYSALFALEREWFQTWIFNKKTDERVHFRFDAAHAVMASHHQKFVVIDGSIAFVGGLDICENRWDDRLHLADNPHRIDQAGEPYGPNHEVQAFVSGPVARKFAEIFITRWADSGGGDIVLETPPGRKEFNIKPTLSIKAKKVAISRTQGKTLVPIRDSIREIRSLYIDAIASADALIYMENQYFSSHAVYTALMDRMKENGRPRLEIVMVFPRKPQAFVEELAVGIAQARMFNDLRETASRHGHAFGLYYTSSSKPGGDRVPVHIHSKLLLIDDRFLTVGSANTTNRSMGLDSELNVSWEAQLRHDRQLLRSIRITRIVLLTEHTGLRGLKVRQLGRVGGLVDFLDRLSSEGRSRISHIKAEDYLSGNTWFKDLAPEDLSIDPEIPVIEENLFEIISHDKSSLFAKGITALNRWLSGREQASLPPARQEEEQPILGPGATHRFSLLLKLLIAIGTVVFLLLVAAIIAIFFS